MSNLHLLKNNYKREYIQNKGALMSEEIIGWIVAITNVIYCFLWICPIIYIYKKYKKENLNYKQIIKYSLISVFSFIIFYALTYPIANKYLYVDCFLYPLIQSLIPSIYLCFPLFIISSLGLIYIKDIQTRRQIIFPILLVFLPIYYALTFNFVWNNSNYSFKYNLIVDSVFILSVIFIVSFILISTNFSKKSRNSFKNLKDLFIFNICLAVVLTITLPFGINYAVLMSELFNKPQITTKLQTYSQKTCIFKWQKKLLYKFHYNMSNPCKIE